jgi:hypothetical protein
VQRCRSSAAVNELLAVADPASADRLPRPLSANVPATLARRGRRWNAEGVAPINLTLQGTLGRLRLLAVGEGKTALAGSIRRPLKRVQRRAALLCCSSVVLCRVSSAAAGSPDWKSVFSWNAPAQCPVEAEVLAKLSAVLSSDGFGDASLDLGQTQLAGSITREGTSWVLALRVTDERGTRTRELQAEQCEDLAQAAALALALLLEQRPEAAGTGAPAALGPAPPPEPVPSPAPASAASPEGAEATPSSAAQHMGLALGVEGLVDSSTLADVALGASVQAQWRLGNYGLGGYAVFLPAQRRAVSAQEYVEFSHFSAGLRACGAIAGGPLGVDVCAGGEAGTVSAWGRGLVDARQANNLWLAPSVGLLGRWRGIATGALTSRLELLFPLLRQPYVINGTQTVHETPSWTARWALGIELDLL